MLIYITGGARSGKSLYAQNMARRWAKRVVFVATALPNDGEMRRRIARHRLERPHHWKTIENPADLNSILRGIRPRAELLLVDCLTLYVSARVIKGEGESKISAQVEKFCKAAALSPVTTILISNEVGSGVVPAKELGRKFRDCAGR